MTEPSSEPSTALNSREQNEVEDGEEDSKFPLRSNPELDVAHTLERPLYLGHSGNETSNSEYRHRLAVHGYHITYTEHNGRTAKQLLVGETELHAEEHRKKDGHARKGGIKQEKHVLNHEVGSATYAIQRTEIKTSAELKAKSGQHIYPWLDTTRHPLFHHRHGKAHIWRRTAGSLHKKFC